MRHLFVTQDYGPDLGGMARRHVELCRRAGPDSLSVSTVAHAAAASFDAGEPYAVHRQPFTIRHANRFTNQVRWSRWLADACRGGADVVHCGNIRPCGYAAWWARRRTGTPYIVYVYGGDVLREIQKSDRALKRETARRIFEGAAGIVSISDWTSDATREAMQRVGVASAPPVATIPLGTDPAWFTPARDAGSLREKLGLGDAPLLLTVARLVPHKGQDVAMRALASLRRAHPDLRYLLVGEGHDETRLRTLAHELGVTDYVVFAGVLSDDEIAEAYATATIYVGLSRVDRGINAEGFGISFVEAGASGVPSVAGDSGGVRAAVWDGETGFVVPPRDAAAASEAIGRLLDDPDLRARMGAAARRAAETTLNWDRVASETFDFARDVSARAVPR